MTGQPETAPEPSDDVLVARVLGGEEQALSILYRRHVLAIYRFILAQVREVEDAEDLTADTFARMLRGLGGFRGEASFRNWLYQIARNAVRNHHRSARYRLTVPLSTWVEAGASAPEAEAADDSATVADGADVLALLQPLPPRYRQVLELRFLAGYSIEDTAVHMGISVANAKVLQHRALKKAAQPSRTEAELGSGSTRR